MSEKIYENIYGLHVTVCSDDDHVAIIRECDNGYEKMVENGIYKTRDILTYKAAYLAIGIVYRMKKLKKDYCK